MKKSYEQPFNDLILISTLTDKVHCLLLLAILKHRYIDFNQLVFSQFRYKKSTLELSLLLVHQMVSGVRAN